MKIKMITLAASPKGNLLAGHEYAVPVEVSQAEADALVAGGYAVIAKAAVATEPAPVSSSESIETADLKVPEESETADLPSSEDETVEKAKPLKKNKSKES